MIGTSARCCMRRQWCGVMTTNHTISKSAQRRCYSKKQEEDRAKIAKCCKDTSQTKGREVVDWPSSEHTVPPWRKDCPCGPQPPNYDPYRIKVPEVVVPPLPQTNAREVPNEDGRQLFDMPGIEDAKKGEGPQDLFKDSGIAHPEMWSEVQERREDIPYKGGLVSPRLSYHGVNKYKFAFHEPYKPLDRVTLLAEAEKEEQDTADVRTAMHKYPE